MCQLSPTWREGASCDRRKDKTLEIVGTDISRLTFNGQPANPQSAAFKLTEQCTYLSFEGLSIKEYVTDDTQKRVWIIHVPKHLPRRPVLAHKKSLAEN